MKKCTSDDNCNIFAFGMLFNKLFKQMIENGHNITTINYTDLIDCFLAENNLRDIYCFNENIKFNKTIIDINSYLLNKSIELHNPFFDQQQKFFLYDK
ncbi:hypothetical protein HZS_3240 [Henneguya salminicola]|nr:hypothetical protein HZS_3240 [Henneguya salminicola]